MLVEVRGRDGGGGDRRGGVGDVSVRVVRDDRHRVARVVLQERVVVGVLDVGVRLRVSGNGGRDWAVAGPAHGHDVNVPGGDVLCVVARGPVHAEVAIAGGIRKRPRRRRLRERIAHVHRRAEKAATRAVLHAEDVGQRACGAGGRDRRIVAAAGAAIRLRQLVRAHRVGARLGQRFRAVDLRRRRRRIGGAASRIARADQLHYFPAERLGPEVPAGDQLQRLALARAHRDGGVRVVDQQRHGACRERGEHECEGRGQAHVASGHSKEGASGSRRRRVSRCAFARTLARF